MEKINGTLKTYENNCMSLSCKGIAVIKDNKIVDLSLRGYPRTFGDRWTGFFEYKNINKIITQEQIDNILSYHTKHNVISRFEAT